MTSKPKAIFLCKFLPYSKFSGGAIRTLNWIIFLSKRYDLIVIGFQPNTEVDSKNELAGLAYREIAYKLKGGYLKKLMSVLSLLFANKSYSISKYTDRRVAEKVREVVISEKVEFIFCSELSSLANINIDQDIYYLDDHNIEFELMQRRGFEKIKPLKWFFCKEANAIRRFELKAAEKARHTFVVSQRDRELLKSLVASSNNRVVENCLPESVKITKPKRSETPLLVFIGTLSWTPNYEGINRFIRNIFPLLKSDFPEVELLILGSGDANKVLSDVKGVKVYSNIGEGEKNKILGEASIAIAPIYAGSGSRIKILEYWLHALPVVSTTIGAEGLGRTSGTIQTKDDRAFYLAVRGILENPEVANNLGKANLKLYQSNYEFRKIYEDSLYNTFNTK
jgi:glycosyltransferase involved in cell wall biosynthesis